MNTNEKKNKRKQTSWQPKERRMIRSVKWIVASSSHLLSLLVKTYFFCLVRSNLQLPLENSSLNFEWMLVFFVCVARVFARLFYFILLNCCVCALLLYFALLSRPRKWCRHKHKKPTHKAERRKKYEKKKLISVPRKDSFDIFHRQCVRWTRERALYALRHMNHLRP